MNDFVSIWIYKLNCFSSKDKSKRENVVSCPTTRIRCWFIGQLLRTWMLSSRYVFIRIFLWNRVYFLERKKFFLGKKRYWTLKSIFYLSSIFVVSVVKCFSCFCVLRNFFFVFCLFNLFYPNTLLLPIQHFLIRFPSSFSNVALSFRICVNISHLVLSTITFWKQ